MKVQQELTFSTRVANETSKSTTACLGGEVVDVDAVRKAAKAAREKEYRSRPVVANRRAARRADERRRERERRAVDPQYDERLRAKELEYERKRESSRSPEEIEKKRAYRRDWYQSLSPGASRRHRDLERARRIGVTVEEIDRAREVQGNACAICRAPFPTEEQRADLRIGNAEHADHCHATGRFRGLLCGGCNTSLGKLGDSRLGIERALSYLSPPGDPDCF